MNPIYDRIEHKPRAPRSSALAVRGRDRVPGPEGSQLIPPAEVEPNSADPMEISSRREASPKDADGTGVAKDLTHARRALGAFPKTIGPAEQDCGGGLDK